MLHIPIKYMCLIIRQSFCKNLKQESIIDIYRMVKKSPMEMIREYCDTDCFVKFSSFLLT